MSDDRVNLGVAGLEDIVMVGRGGFATVYRAYQPAFRRTVAVKVLSVTTVDESTRERFRRECQAMGLLSEHPSIVTVLDAGFLEDERPYLVMAYMPGGSLADRLRSEGPMSWQEASRAAVRLAGALDTAHQAGVLHRDVKPANVLLSPYGEPQLADFGIARVAGGPETSAGTFTASLGYAPPEIVEGAPPSVASDVYSLAATVHALVTGHPPFSKERDTTIAGLLHKILNGEVPDVRPLGVPDDMAALLERAMAKDPTDRPASAAEFGSLVRLAQDNHGLRATRLVVFTPTEIPAADPQTLPDPEATDIADAADLKVTPMTQTAATPAESSPVQAKVAGPAVAPLKAAPGWRRHPAVWVGVGAVLTAVIALGASSIFGGTDEPQQAAPPSTTSAPAAAPVTTAKPTTMLPVTTTPTATETPRSTEAPTTSVPPSIATSRPPDPPSAEPVAGLDLSWLQIPKDITLGGAGRQEMRTVVVSDGRFVAGGLEIQGEGVHAAVWLSADGTSWTRSVHDSSVFGGGDDSKQMLALTAGGPGLVAVGFGSIWISADGLSWTLLPPQAEITESEALLDVAQAGPGLLATGYGDVGGDRDARIWTSTDGITWSRVSPVEEVFGGGGSQQINAVVEGDAGLVAVGSAEEDDRSVAAVWTSSDGLSWSRVPHDHDVLGQSDGAVWMEDVTWTGNGYVAAGIAQRTDHMDGAIWTSDDGLAWTRVSSDGADFAGAQDQWIRSVTGFDAGYVAVGSSAWYSPDGAAWSMMDGDGTVHGLEAAASTAQLVIAVGWTDCCGDTLPWEEANAGVWLAVRASG